MPLNRLIVSALLIAFSTIAASGQQTLSFPDSPVGRQTTELLKTFESGDRSEISNFIENHFAQSFLEAIPLQQHVDLNVEFAQRSGGITPVEVLSSTDTRIRFRGRSRKGNDEFQVTIEVEADAPHKISGISVMAPPPWSKVPAPPLPEGSLTEQELSRYLHDYLTALAKSDAFSGAVMVAHDDHVVFHEAFGLASRAWQVPNKSDTKFNLGSMNKMFTSVAIAQLVEQGKLSLDDVIGKTLPDYPNKDAAEKVTIRHLLTHTSGIGDYFNEKFMKSSRDQFRDIKDFLPLFAEEPLQFEPGSRFRYSNGGFIVLGAIIEKVAGQDYFQYVREHIYQPSGMQNTDCYEVDSDTPNLAVGYTRQGAQQDGQWKNNLLLHVVRGGPAGGGYSTVEDLLHFAEALERGKLLKSETLEQWTTPSDKSPNYAYGFEIDNESGHRAFGHRGGFPGVSSMLLIDRQSGITTVILSNMDNGAMPVAEKLRDLSSRW